MDELLREELLRARWRRARTPLGLVDPTAEDFGVAGLAGRLDKDAQVRLVVLPPDPEANLVEFNEAMWSWWLKDRADPIGSGLTSWSCERDVVTTPTAMVRFSSYSDGDTWSRYLALHRHGGVEAGLSSDVIWDHEGPQEVMLVRVAGRLWSALDAQGAVAERLGMGGPWQVVLAITGCEGAFLHNFASGWADPHTFPARDMRKPCTERSLLHVREVDSWLDKDGVRDLVFGFGAWIEDAWGSRQRRFIARRGEWQGGFDPSQYGWS